MGIDGSSKKLTAVRRILAIALGIVILLSAQCVFVFAKTETAIEPDTAIEPETKPFDGLDIIAAVGGVDESVVGIIGKISQESRSYSEYSDNIAVASGIILKANGYIVTNAHVVEDLEAIYVVLSNRKVYEAYVVATDTPSDLALIKISKGMLKPVVFAKSSDVKVGTMVLTVGTPLEMGLQNSVSMGIISGVNRTIGDFTEYSFIQTDASANPGNSGGPVVNMNGEVIGIIVGGYSYFQGLSFCIPSDTITYVMSHFEKYGYVKRPYIGATLVKSLLSDYGLILEPGVTVMDVQDGMAADNAGMKEGDILISVNGADIYGLIGYNEEMKKYLPGDTVDIVAKRDGEVMEFSLVFGEEE